MTPGVLHFSSSSSEWDERTASLSLARFHNSRRRYTRSISLSLHYVRRCSPLQQARRLLGERPLGGEALDFRSVDSFSVVDVVSVVAGYQYLPDSDAVVVVNGKRFSLFTNGERAWARDTQTDKAVVQLLLKGKKSFTVKGTSSRSNVTTDVFPLAGFSAAHQSITDACKKI